MRSLTRWLAPVLAGAAFAFGALAGWNFDTALLTSAAALPLGVLAARLAARSPLLNKEAP